MLNKSAEVKRTQEDRQREQEKAESPKKNVGTVIGLDGIKVSEEGVMTKTRYFNTLDIDQEKYGDIAFTEEEAIKISRSIRHLSTGINAAVPLTCAGSQCPFEATCAYVEIGKAPIGRPCHPPGTNIYTANRGYVEIQNLNTEEDKIVCFGASSAGGTKKLEWRGSDFKLAKRFYSGELITLETDAESHESTDNHICLARWNDSAKDKLIVYMMQSGDKFRIGKTSLFKFSGKGKMHSGLLARARKEGASKAWILGYYDTNSEALLAEEYFSCSWGIPKAYFIASNHGQVKYDGLYKRVTQEQLDDHFSKLCKPICEYDKLLRSIGLRYEYPIVNKMGLDSISRQRDFSMKKAFEIEACNMVSGLMDIPVASSISDVSLRSDTPEYKRLKTSRRHYDGFVYSMGVSKHETYVANNIITHNCLVEAQLIVYWTQQFIEEFNVDINNFTEVQLVSELAEFNIYELRVTKYLAEKHQTLMQDVVTSVDVTGEVIENQEVSRAFDLKERIKRNRMKVLEALMATRKERVKISAERNTGTSTAAKLTELREKLDEYLGDIKKQKPIDATIISNEKNKEDPQE